MSACGKTKTFRCGLPAGHRGECFQEEGQPVRRFDPPPTLATYTYAIMQLSQAAYDEIAAKIREAGYDHAFHEEGVIDLHGIAVQPESEEEP